MWKLWSHTFLNICTFTIYIYKLINLFLDSPSSKALIKFMRNERFNPFSTVTKNLIIDDSALGHPPVVLYEETSDSYC